MNNLFLKITYSLFRRKVGQDSAGNEYYESKFAKREFARKSRAILYNGLVEPSKIEPSWYNWLHYMTDEIPTTNKKKDVWELDRLPNLTGTKHAFYPSGSLLGRGSRKKATGDYEQWRP